MASRPSQISFSRVSVCIPSQVRGSEAEEEWQEVDWVKWDQGELLVDGDGFLMVFKPSVGNVKPIPMGNLIGAEVVGDGDDSQRTLVVNASDSMYRQLRFSFETAKQVSEFMNLAQTAQARHAAVSDRDEACRAADAPVTSALVAALKEKYSKRCPLVFDGVELYSDSMQNLLGNGAIMLLDPEESENKVGQYSLLFFSADEASSPLKTFSIGPQMLKRMPDEEDNFAACYEFSSGGVAVHQFAFNDLDIALAFARDFRVRAKLMDVALKTVNRGNQVREARSKIDDLRRNSLSARLFRFVCTLLVLMTVGIVVRVGLLYKEHPDKAPQEYLPILAKEASHVWQILRAHISQAGSQVCELAFGSVSVAQLQKCTGLGDASKINECLFKYLPTS